MPEKKEKPSFLQYKNKPLVRCGNILYYGSMTDKYVVMLQLVNYKKENEVEVPATVRLQLMATAPDMPARDRIEKHAEEQGFYNALDVASVWLERQLSE